MQMRNGRPTGIRGWFDKGLKHEAWAAYEGYRVQEDAAEEKTSWIHDFLTLNAGAQKSKLGFLFLAYSIQTLPPRNLKFLFFT